MTNAISRDAAHHFANSMRFKRSNTEVAVEVIGEYTFTRLLLHDNLIAEALSNVNTEREWEVFSIRTAGWPTQVTKARLNALSGAHPDFPSFQVKTLGGELLFNDRRWDGSWKCLINGGVVQ